MSRVLVALSGGVDSSMSAKLLKDAGHEVSGVYLRLHDLEHAHAENIRKATIVAEYLGIDFEVLDRSEAFKKEVFEPFLHEYEAGRTPNPCTLCNRQIKFGELADYAISKGFDFLATGHYVQTDGHFLYEAVDGTKDQSYFLFNLRPSILPHLMFPMAKYKKEQIKALAAQIEEFAELSTQGESQEICFVETTYIDRLKERYEVDKAGPIVDEGGKVVGRHAGYMHYTIGKRKGLDVPLSQVPLYVKSIDPATNTIVAAEHHAVMAGSFYVEQLNLFGTKEQLARCYVKVRYRSRKTPCRVEFDGERAKVLLDVPEFAIASGQAAVFYDGERVLGGGYIA